MSMGTPVAQHEVSGTTSTSASENVLSREAANINNTRTGIQTSVSGVNGTASPISNTTSGETDYTQRKAQVPSLRKVSLVGRYGGGTSNVWGGATQAAKTSTTDFSTVTFEITPQLTESGTVSTVDIGEIRSAGSIIVYLGSPARTFSISATFVSRTMAEASETFRAINLLKAWRMPQSNNDEPETIRLFAYDKTLKGIPCMMQSLNIEWGDDVDYIPAANGANVPIIQKVSIGLKEVRNWDDIQKFDYVNFKQGTLDQW